jgi:signal transduction histidine kinase
VPKRGIGLIGIAERVRMLGGNWTMEAAIGKGATICIMIERVQGG